MVELALPGCLIEQSRLKEDERQRQPEGEDDYDRTYYADPSTRPANSYYHGSGGHYFWGSSRGYGGGSSVHGGTSRGGFGASGHAAAGS